MEPMTALAFTALTVVASGITAGATGKLGEGVATAAMRWLERLRQHSSETVKRLAAVSDPSVIDAEIIEEVEQVTASQPNVQAAMEETVAAIEADQSSFQNLTKIADNVGSVFIGDVHNPTFHQTF